MPSSKPIEVGAKMVGDKVVAARPAPGPLATRLATFAPKDRKREHARIHEQHAQGDTFTHAAHVVSVLRVKEVQGALQVQLAITGPDGKPVKHSPPNGQPDHLREIQPLAFSGELEYEVPDGTYHEEPHPALPGRTVLVPNLKEDPPAALRARIQEVLRVLGIK